MLRVLPAPVKSTDERRRVPEGVARVAILRDERIDVRAVERPRVAGSDADQAPVGDGVVAGRQPSIGRLDGLVDESGDLSGRAGLRSIHGHQGAAGEGAGIHGVGQGLAVVAEHAEVHDQRGEAQDHHQDDREQDEDLAALALCPAGVAARADRQPGAPHSSTIWTVELIGMVAPKSSGKKA